MKKFTKLLLALTLCVLGVGSAQATKLYADLSKLGNGPVSTWDGNTNTMTWTGTSNNMISNFDFAAGDYSAYTTISIKVSDLANANGIRLQIKANGQEKLVALNGNGTFTKNLIDDFGFTKSDLASLSWIRVLGSAYQNGESHTIDADHPASAVISKVYLYQPSKTLEVDLTKMAESEGNASWNSSTGVFAWTGTYSNAITLPGLSGNLSAYTTVSYETTAKTCNHFRILIYYSNGAGQTTYFASVGNKSVTFEDMGVTAANLASVASIKISGASDATGDIILTSFSLDGPLVNYIEATTVYEAPIGTTDLNGMTGTGTIKWNVAYPKDFVNETSWCGDIDSDNNSVDIDSYDYLHFVVTNVSADAKCGLRVFVSSAPSTNNSTRVCLYPTPIDNNYGNDYDWTPTSWISKTGTYIVKISDYPLLRGFKALQGWAGNAGKITVSQVYLSKGAPVAYVPSGKYTLVGETTGSATLAAALADANATYYDATGVIGTGAELTPANPNALFVANAGTLSNTKNVIVDDVCANLELTDEKPFKAPANFTASTAKLTKTVSSADFATMVLPFDANLPEGVKAYDIEANSGNILTTKAVSEITANEPVLLKNAGTFEFTATDVLVEALDGVFTKGLLNGVYATTDVPTTNGYVLQKQGDDVNFYKAAAGQKVNAFRAYLTATAGARLILNFDNEEEVTDIQTVKTASADKKIFNLNGQRMAQPVKGLNIIGGKKVMK